MKLTAAASAFTQSTGVDYPIIGGPMYPCSNPELVAAISAGGGLGVVQPVSLTYVYGYELRAGLRYIRSLTDKPIGMNALIERSSRRYHQRMQQWIDIALEEGIRFFITSLGKPDWVVNKVHAAGGLVYHDATLAKWARKAVDSGVDGLIAVNNRAGGHAGGLDAAALYRELAGLGLPLISAGGISTHAQLRAALDLGYAGVQLGTRFIATTQCAVSEAYKQAIVDAGEKDIVLTERLSGIPVAVIRNPYVERTGLRPGPVLRLLLGHAKGKYLARTFLALRSLYQLKRSARAAAVPNDYWQAGKSVAGIDSIDSVDTVIRRLLGEQI